LNDKVRKFAGKFKVFAAGNVMPHSRVNDIDRSLKLAEILPNPEFKRPVNPPMTDELQSG